MPQNQVSKELDVKGMSCSGCEIKIENRLKPVSGILKVKASYNSEKVYITYDENEIKLWQIKKIITELGYYVTDTPANVKNNESANYNQIAIIAIIILGGAVIINRLGGFAFFSYFPEAKTGMSYAAIFVIGLLTSVHCVGMCGGICLSQCVGAKGSSSIERMRPSFLYNIGRIVSYTILGGFVGALGSVVSFSGVMRGAVAIFAGIFMIIMGLNMLNIFPFLRKFSLRMPKFLTRNISSKSNSNSPFYIGLLNGFMPCGPLQSMQLYALSTGSAVQGAISMFIFALGTSVLMFGFGSISSMLSKKSTKNIMTISAVLVIILGFGMFNTGLNMSGFLAVGTEKSDISNFEPVIVDGYQIVTVDVLPRKYAPITLKKDIPAKINFYVEDGNINGCNNVIIIQQYDTEVPLNVGDNVVEFTPAETGTIPYSCWMNMIRSSITVVE